MLRARATHKLKRGRMLSRHANRSCPRHDPLSAPVHPSVTLWPPDETTRRDLLVCLHYRGSPSRIRGRPGRSDRLRDGARRTAADRGPRRGQRDTRRHARRAGVGRRAGGERLHPERPARRRAGHLRHRGPRRSTTTRRSTSACSRKDDRARPASSSATSRRTSTPGRATASASSSTRSHDRRNGYQFATNPAGAKWDAQMANEGRENNANWDGIWEVRTRITEIGWYAEIRIPFRTLKFDRRRSADLGHELRAQDPPPQRGQLLVAAAAHLQPRARLAGRHARRACAACGPARNLRVKPYALGSIEHHHRPRYRSATSTLAST